MGGVGKTRLAVEYAWRYASDYGDALLFVSARSPVDLRANLAELCNPPVLNLPEWSQPQEIVRLAGVLRWLCEHSGWLLILDNADTTEAAAEVEKMLPRLQCGEVIITSRIADWSTAVQPVDLDVLPEEDAAAFLLERTESRRKKMLTDSEDAAAVARDLGGLALALEQGGAYIAKIRVSFSEYRKRWESRKEEVLAWHDERLMQYPESVATTWQTTIEELSHSERKLLNILAWFAPEPIPQSLLEGNSVDGADACDALAGLASWSLARWNDDEGFSVHRLVQEVTRQRLSDNDKQDSLKSAVTFLDRALPSPEWDEKGWQLWERLAPHCRNLLNRLKLHVLEPRATGIMNGHGVWLNNRAEYGEAEPLLRRALAIDEKSLGPEHPKVATVLNNLALLLSETNRLAEAEPLLRRALAIDEKRFGPDHLKVAIRLNNLAGLLSETNRLAEAEPLLRRALAIDEKGLGLERPKVATILNNLAELLRETNRLAEAEPLLRRALAIDEKSLGLEHPNVAGGLINLALLLRETNRLAEAESLLRRALAINEKSLGPEHPNVATGLNDLAELLRETDRLAEAEPLYRRALAIDQKSLGPEHPNVARDINNLAWLLRETNRLAEAEPLFRRALRILAEFGHRTGHEHPHFRKAIDNYEALISAMGLSQDAIAARVRSSIEGDP